MKNNLFNTKFTKIFSIIYFLLIIFVMLFGRTFTGLYVFNLRLGEVIIALCFLLSSFLLFYNKKIFNQSQLLLVHKMIVIMFFLNVTISSGSLLSTYTYKTSSYIWTLIFLYLGSHFFHYLENDNFGIEKIIWALPFAYIFSSIYYPKFLQNYFVKYSDTLDFLKASDLLLLYTVTNFYLFIKRDNKFSFSYLILSSAVLFPYLSFKSKGSILPAVLFLLLIFYYYRFFFVKNIKFVLLTLIVGSMLFIFSSLRTFGSFNNISYEVFFTEYSEDSPMHERFTNFQSISKTQPERYSDLESNSSSESENNMSNSPSQIDQVIYENVNQFWIFTLADGRLYSRETNIDYRLQIWQDVLFDLNFQDKILTGYAYNEIIPAMTPRERQGWDGSNENVHNYLVNIFARGGLIQLTLFLILYYYLIKEWYLKNKNFQIIVFILPIFLTSLFDVSMESVRYPFIYFTFLGYFLSTKNLQK
tara:strand:- start:2970 stop:4388 length:1419 start_codon:yes stop_codon:yes gene_type:complete